jgi:putative DNA primase/helicase
LTILRAFHVAGRPSQTVPLGSFTTWSGWVRDALVWLGEADPCETMEGMRGADPKLEALTAALEEWRSVIGTDRVTVREIIERAAAQQTQLFGKAEFVSPEFREALLRVAGEGGAINGTRLGKWLSQHQNRVVAGHRIIAAGTTGNRARWQLDIVNADAAPIINGSDLFRRAANA